MKKLILILFLMVFAVSVSHGQSLKRVPKNNKSNTSKTDTATKRDNKGIEKKSTGHESNQPKDEFIDRDDDGVNDNISIKRPPEVKKPIKSQKPKIERPKVSPPSQKPSNAPPKVAKPATKEPPKTEPAKKEPSSSSKKSRR